MNFPAMLLTGGAVSFFVCLLIVATKRFHGHLSLDSTVGVQKFHLVPTPRIGGLAICAGVVVACATAPTDVADLLFLMLVAGLPAFAAGILEDVTKRVSVRTRLLVTMVSGLLAWALTDISLTRVNVVGVDWLLGFVPISVLFTMFAVGGAANAFNIIDGFNGLAGGVTMISLAALGGVAYQVNDIVLVQICIALGVVSLGFMLLNFPYGKIFLGDGGAYLLGFLVAWVAILLPMRNDSVSVWASLLACAYPILETCFSIARKSRRRGHHPGQPDNVHLHMLLYRRVSKRVYPSASPALQNGLTSPFGWTYALIPAAFAVLWPTETALLVFGLFASALIYRALYLRLTQFRWCFSTNRKRHLAPVSQG